MLMLVIAVKLLKLEIDVTGIPATTDGMIIFVSVATPLLTLSSILSFQAMG
jgi:hypothetical protein